MVEEILEKIEELKAGSLQKYANKELFYVLHQGGTITIECWCSMTGRNDTLACYKSFEEFLEAE